MQILVSNMYIYQKNSLSCWDGWFLPSVMRHGVNLYRCSDTRQSDMVELFNSLIASFRLPRCVPVADVSVRSRRIRPSGNGIVPNAAHTMIVISTVQSISDEKDSECCMHGWVHIKNGRNCRDSLLNMGNRCLSELRGWYTSMPSSQESPTSTPCVSGGGSIRGVS